MYRFILLYVCHDDNQRCFAEGLVLVDKTVYVRGFYPEEGKLYADIYVLKRALRDNESIRSWHVQMIDVVEVRGANGI